MMQRKKVQFNYLERRHYYGRYKLAVAAQSGGWTCAVLCALGCGVAGGGCAGLCLADGHYFR